MVGENSVSHMSSSSEEGSLASKLMFSITESSQTFPFFFFFLFSLVLVRSRSKSNVN